MKIWLAPTSNRSIIVYHLTATLLHYITSLWKIYFTLRPLRTILQSDYLESPTFTSRVAGGRLVPLNWGQNRYRSLSPDLARLQGCCILPKLLDLKGSENIVLHSLQNKRFTKIPNVFSSNLRLDIYIYIYISLYSVSIICKIIPTTKNCPLKKSQEANVFLD